GVAAQDGALVLDRDDGALVGALENLERRHRAPRGRVDIWRPAESMDSSGRRRPIQATGPPNRGRGRRYRLVTIPGRHDRLICARRGRFPGANGVASPEVPMVYSTAVCVLGCCLSCSPPPGPREGLAGSWWVNGNGFTGELVVKVAAGGKVEGTIYG